jgi:hypothetical protein
LLTVALALIARQSRRTRDREPAVVLATLFISCELMHSAFVKLEWFYRYEAYLMVLGVVSLAFLWSSDEGVRERARQFKRLPAGRLVLVLLALPLAIRAASALGETPLATRNVFEQQYQLGLFFRQELPDAPIALNDIGAVSWLTTTPVVDVYGLATQAVADLKRQGRWDASAVKGLLAARGVRAVAMYECALAPLIPASWTLVGEWEIRDNVAVSGQTVGFFAPAPTDVDRLRTALERFGPRLPPDVRWRTGLTKDERYQCSP